MTAERVRTRLRAWEWAVLGALAVLSAWLAVALIFRARATDTIWTGTDGPYLGDQMQYLGWVRDASDNLLVGNPFRLDGSADHFLHPGLAISGMLNHLGLPAPASYLMWKPVAVIALFFAVRFYVRRTITETVPRAAALLLALFGLSPFQQVYGWIGRGPASGFIYFRPMALDMWPGLYLWGYPFTALAVASLPATLLLYERARRQRALTWAAWGAAACGLMCAWLQPWQGGTLLAVIVAVELILWHRDRTRPGRVVAVTLGATVLPLVYYACLSRFDSGWQLAGQYNRAALFPWWAIPLFFLPVIVLASLEYRRPEPTFRDLALRAWPIAGIAVFLAINYTPFGTFPLHALQGLSIPVAIIVVRGLTSLRPSWRSPVVLVPLVVVLFACLGPVLVHELDTSAQAATHSPTTGFGSNGSEPYLISPDEHAALTFLDDEPGEGGVLARVRLGQTVPGLSGRPTWVGIGSWTPDYKSRIAQADKLFTGGMDPETARRFVEASGARYLLSDCRPGVDLEPELGSLVAEVHRFGCATVYRLA